VYTDKQRDKNAPHTHPHHLTIPTSYAGYFYTFLYVYIFIILLIYIYILNLIHILMLLSTLHTNSYVIQNNIVSLFNFNLHYYETPDDGQ
jgi:hypothetical protein